MTAVPRLATVPKASPKCKSPRFWSCSAPRVVPLSSKDGAEGILRRGCFGEGLSQVSPAGLAGKMLRRGRTLFSAGTSLKKSTACSAATPKLEKVLLVWRGFTALGTHPSAPAPS